MKRRIAVHAQNDYENSFSIRWMEYINSTNDFEAIEIDLKKENFLNDVRECDGVMWHYRHTPQDKQIASKVLPAIECGMNIPVFPNFYTRWHFDEKVAQNYLFDAIKLPHIPSWVFWKYEDAMRFLESEKEFPLVFKLSCGAGSANICKLNEKNEAIEIIEKMFGAGVFPYTDNEYRNYSMDGLRNYPAFTERLNYAIRYVKNKKMPPMPAYWQLQKDYVYFQKFMPDNSYDIRITIIGNRAFGFIRHNRKDDFRASGSGKIEYDQTKIPLNAIEIAFQLAKKAHLQSVGIDFLLNEKKEPLINEMSYGFSAKAVHECPGYWDDQLVWHDGHVWPEHAQAEDFLNMIRSNAEFGNV